MHFNLYKFLGILRYKLSCSNDDVVNYAGKHLMQHLENNLIDKFKNPWKALNTSLPWQHDGMVTMRQGNPITLNSLISIIFHCFNL